MADIFISYSQKDADTARVIAALLSAQGYSVWYDTQLLSGDKYRQVIMKELDAARAVVVLWTSNSAKSDFVQAEANRAYSDRKLVPLKQRLLPYDQIPLPFGNLHTINFDNHEAVLAAVEAQLARPVAPPVVWKRFRYEALAWFGIIGGALTIVNHWTNFITLADWMRWVVSNFSAIMHRFWSFLGSLIGFNVPPGASKMLSFLLFYVSLTFGSVLLSGKINRIYLRIPYSYKNTIVVLFAVIASSILTSCNSMSCSKYDGFIAFMIFLFPIIMLIDAKPENYSDNYSGIFASILLLVSFVFNIKMLNNGFYSMLGNYYISKDVEIILFLSSIVIVSIPLLVVPSRVLEKRLAYLLIGVALIFGLSEVSKQVEKFRTAATTVETH